MVKAVFAALALCACLLAGCGEKRAEPVRRSVMVAEMVAAGTPVVTLLDVSARSRVRPVTMASLTTIVGMVPLVSDPMYGSMAITIMGGLTVGTVITLLLLPLFYTALFNIKRPQEANETQLTR